MFIFIFIFMTPAKTPNRFFSFNTRVSCNDESVASCKFRDNRDGGFV